MTADVDKLICKNFRSYRSLALNFTSKFVVFYGENGSGKTNILEALSMFASGRGFRKALIADLTSIGSGPSLWNLDLIVRNGQYNTFLSTNTQNGKRIAKIDNSVTPTLSKFEDILWILWIVPKMNNIFISTISERRKFFDHLVSGYNKRYKVNLRKLADLQRERLHVIFHRKNEQWLKILEEKISEKNIAITKVRLEFIYILHEIFKNYPSDFLRPTVCISGIIEEIYLSNSEEDALLKISLLLKNSRFTDSEKQSTEVSTQKSFWKVNNPQNNLEAEHCSTGEQKAFLISLILGMIRIYKRERTGIPILLLDDLMVHLDENRRSSLAKELKDLNVQTFFTGTDISFFNDVLDIAQIYHVKNSICSQKL